MPSGASYNNTISLSPLMPVSDTDSRDLVKPVISVNRSYNLNGNSKQSSNVTVNANKVNFITDNGLYSYYTLTDELDNTQHYFNGRVTMNDSLRALAYYIEDGDGAYQSVVDHVIEINTDGMWHIQKWLSGRVILTAYKAYPNISCSKAWGSWYETSTDLGSGLKFPDNLLVDLWYINISPALANQVYFIEYKPANDYKNIGSIWLCRPTSETLYTPCLFFYAIGRWK